MAKVNLLFTTGFSVHEQGVRLIRYFGSINLGRLILWSYLIWYLLILVLYFDPDLQLWLTSLGISAIIGIALYISTAHAGRTRVRLDRWQVFRLFLMPFCVSSFSALVKGQGFILIFSRRVEELLWGAGLIGLFCAWVWVCRNVTLPRLKSPGAGPAKE